MNIVLDLVQFMETSVLFSITMFCIFLYWKTRDAYIGRTLGLLFPTSVYFIISYSYSYFTKYFETFYANDGNQSSIGWVSYFFAIFAIVTIAMSIITVYRYGMSLIPVTSEKRKLGIISVSPIAVAFLILSIFYVTFKSIDNPKTALESVMGIVYPIGSLPSFALAIVMLFYIKGAKAGGNMRLIQYFLAAFLPQAAYTVIDLILLQKYTYQFTHISYLVFSLLSFYYISSHYFLSYESTSDIHISKRDLIETYNLSEREMEVLELLANGKINAEIAESLCISVNTVKSHVKNIYKKLSVSNRVQLLHKIRKTSENQYHLHR